MLSVNITVRHNGRDGVSNHWHLGLGAVQRKHQSSALLAFLGESPGGRWILLKKDQ